MATFTQRHYQGGGSYPRFGSSYVTCPSCGGVFYRGEMRDKLCRHCAEGDVRARGAVVPPGRAEGELLGGEAAHA